MSIEPGRAGRQTYAQWVRWAIGLARSQRRQAITFFDSSVPEPRELLRQTIADAFAARITPDYLSTFGGGNPVIIDILADRYDVAREQVLCTTGATGALSLLYRSLAEPGDHVLVETPGFDLFQDLATNQGLHVDLFSRSGPQFLFDPTEVEGLIRHNTRLIILSNLHNPSGMALDYMALEALARVAERRNVLVIIDEVYGDYARAENRPCPASRLSPNFISISSLTKIFGLSTLRCGWIVGSRPVVDRVRDMAMKFEFGMSNLAHAVAANIMRKPTAFAAYSDGIVNSARPRVDAWFAEHKNAGLLTGELPDDGCICFPKLVDVDDTESFSAWLLERAGVIVAPGEYFGMPGHIRIGFAQTEEDLDRGLAALSDGLRVYRKKVAPSVSGWRSPDESKARTRSASPALDR